jgi:hypothetical protein
LDDPTSETWLTEIPNDEGDYGTDADYDEDLDDVSDGCLASLKNSFVVTAYP